MCLSRVLRLRCQVRPFAATVKPLHRIRNERKQATEKVLRLQTMQERNRDEDLFQRIQNLILPGKSEEELDRPALVAELRLLANLCEAHHQLETLPETPVEEAVRNGVSESTSSLRKKQRRQFNYEEYRTRFVALQVFYIGWDYQGFAAQEYGKTIENALIRAFKRTKLIPESYENSRAIQYSKCGRTDKGVSASGQVVSLMVRSKRKLPEEEASVEEEFDYPTMINAVLPPEIRIWGWTPVQPNFSARYSTQWREYKYFIVTEEAERVDVPLMQECSQRFLGVHNFQNFCKMNLEHTMNHEREILNIEIEPVENIAFPRCSFYTEKRCESRGNAFLWHQVRCIMRALLLVGRGLESPNVIDDLLDVEKTEAKPLYTPASEIPLVLCDANYGEQIPSFHRSYWQLQKNRRQLRGDIHKHLTQLLVLHHIHEKLLATPHHGDIHEERQLVHVPLLNRQREPSFAERMEKHEQRNGPL